MTPLQTQAAAVLRELWCPMAWRDEGRDITKWTLTRSCLRPGPLWAREAAAMLLQSTGLHLDDLLRAVLEEECGRCGGECLDPDTDDLDPCPDCNGRGRR